MYAAVTPQPGALDVVQVETPRPGPGEVLIRMAHAALNPVDQQTVDGVYDQLGWITRPKPTGLGWDLAGTIEALGPDVSDLAVGERVAGISAGVDKQLGSFAELVVLPRGAVATVPAGLDLRDAAMLPLIGLTAWQALDLLGAPDGVLLVTGAAGGVGGHALSLALRRGWDVVGLARDSDRDFVTATGARFTSTLPDDGSVAALVDCATLVEPALATVRDGGRYVGMLPPMVPAARRGISPVAVDVAAHPGQLTGLLALAADGSLPARHASAWPLPQVAEAMRVAAAPGLRGRVTLQP